MLARGSLVLSLLALSACGGGDDNGGMPDAAVQVDAPASTVMEVTCPAQPATTFATQATAFSPSTATITAGQIVKFVSTATHPIGPLPGSTETDPGISVAEGQTKCLKFMTAGTFKFICKVHSYLGTLTVN